MSRRSHTRGRAVSAVIVAILVALVCTALAAGFPALGSAAFSSADLTYSSVHYDTAVESGGDVVVKQNVTVSLEEREDEDGDDYPWRQLFQQYTLDPSQYDDITDISVTDSSGQPYREISPMLPPSGSYTYDDWDTDYSQTWYQDPKTVDGKDVLEIAWNIPLTWETDAIDFTVTMTFTNAVTTSPDGAEFQWEPVSTANQTPIEHLSAHVTFPDGIAKKDVLGWLHYENDSTTTKNADGSLDFTAERVFPGHYVDLRVLLDEAAFDTQRTTAQPLRDRVVEEESAKENEWYSEQRRQAIVRLLLWILAALLTAAGCIWAVWGAITTHRDSQYHGPLDYWREPPAMSPGAAAHLLNLAEPKRGVNERVLSSTILSLASKKAILLLPGSSDRYKTQLTQAGVTEDGALSVSLPSFLTPQPGVNDGGTDDTTTVVLLPAALSDTLDGLHLSRSETAALDLLKTMSEATGDTHFFDLEEVKEPLSENEALARKTQKALEATQSAAVTEFNSLRADVSSTGRSTLPSVLLFVLGAVEAVLLSVSGQLLLAIILGFIAMAVGTWALRWGSSSVLTKKKGQEAMGTVVGLRNYLLDFSSFHDRDTQDLTLWDRYLVYATAFGISSEVIEQLALAQPNVADPTWVDSTMSSYALTYLMFRPRGAFAPGTTVNNFAGGFGFTSLGSQLSANISSIQTTIATATSSSSSSGGGFSSGGSFGGGGFGGGGGGFGGGSFGGR